MIHKKQDYSNVEKENLKGGLEKLKLFPNPNTIFEFMDKQCGMSLLLFKRTDNKFEIHLHNDYTNQALAMVLDIKEFAGIFNSLAEYFQTDKVCQNRLFENVDVRNYLTYFKKNFLPDVYSIEI
ncbi:MAG TPA: hypothetical protein VJ697_07545 [Nitrososphaeraceae archaeon]|nr:hypothetical protein [Nitrososphaeraceae archaeon]